MRPWVSAAMAPRGGPSFWAEWASTAARLGAEEALLYWEHGRRWGTLGCRGGCSHSLLHHPHGFAALAAGGGAYCAVGGYVLPSGSYARIAACAAGGPSRGAAVTAQPPRAARQLRDAVLDLYLRRLLRDGVGFWRIAGLLVTSYGADAAALLVLVEKKGVPPAPLVYASGKAVCLSYAGGGASVLAPMKGCGGRVVHMRPVSGTARVEIRELRKALRG